MLGTRPGGLLCTPFFASRYPSLTLSGRLTVILRQDEPELQVPRVEARMADRLVDLLRECTVEVGDGWSTSTGFFVAPRMVLTELRRKANPSDLTVRTRDNDQLIRIVRLDSPLSMQTEANMDQDTLFDHRLISALLIDDFGYHLSVDIDSALPSKGDPVLIAGYQEVMHVTFSQVNNESTPHGLQLPHPKTARLAGWSRRLTCCWCRTPRMRPVASPRPPRPGPGRRARRPFG
jgi:hypothetical protein